eukprot:3818636-Prymnesium_polylepis.1
MWAFERHWTWFQGILILYSHSHTTPSRTHMIGQFASGPHPPPQGRSADERSAVLTMREVCGVCVADACHMRSQAITCFMTLSSATDEVGIPHPHTHGTVDAVETVSSGARGASNSVVTYENEVAGRLNRFGRHCPRKGGSIAVIKPQKE